MSKNFDELPAADVLTGTETLPVNQGGQTRYSTINAIITFLGSAFDAMGTAASAITSHLGAFAHGDIAHTNRAALNAVSGTNTGDQDISNLAPKADPVFSGAGVKLPNANSADGLRLDWYEEGPWTPGDASAASPSLNVTGTNCKFTRIGNMVFLSGTIVYPTSADANAAYLGGLPFDPAFAQNSVMFSNSGSSAVAAIKAIPGQKISFHNFPGTTGLRLNSNLSGETMSINIAYKVA